MKRYTSEVTSLAIPDSVHCLLLKQRQLLVNDSEAGGILIGRVYTTHVVVEEITLPGPADKRGRFFFERNVEKAQCAVDDAWHKSNGALIYIGEWHTHPENHPQPSPTDRALIRNMLRDSKMEIDFLFLLIVGMNDFYVGIQNGNKLIQLTEIDTPQE